uniref:DOCKER domain-containing protein n=1 Tax=Phytophthora ramorum TaxID=164328 RepID=H3H0P4_PHYRM
MLDKLDCTIPPVALVYVLPTLQLQNLYLVLKVSKVLVGDGDLATAPYCSPDRFASPTEQQKLVEKAADCGRACISEEQRLSLILDAMRGTLKEKIVPAHCEFDVEDISAEELAAAKFKTLEHYDELSLDPSAPPRLEIADPFSEQKVIASGKPESDTSEQHKERSGVNAVRCREVQPFCPSSLVPTLGIAGSGPVAASYVNTLYVYPLQVEKCQYRNVAIRVQLLQKEVDAVRGVEETDAAVLRAIYRANNQVGRSAYALVGYHQKNPQFEDEIKICLPECLTSEHHLLFTLYHVHCKKLQPNQPQQELIGYAALPLLEKDGTIMQDGKYTVNVTPSPASSKPSTSGGGISLSPGYVDVARDGVVDSTKTMFSYRGRVVSSVHSQDHAVAAFLNPFHGSRRAEPSTDPATQEDEIVNRLMGLSQSGAPNVRYFFFMIAKFVLGFLRYGTSIVRWSAFRTLLAVMEKASWNPRGSLKIHEMNRVLHDFVHIVFDENSIDDPNGPQSPSKAQAQHERKSVFGALLETWHNVLNNKASIEENADTKRMSLTYSNVLLQLILKSMAMQLLDHCGSPSNHGANSLPMKLAKNDQVMLERVLGQLVACAGDTSNGLLLQKEVNRSVGYFCRGVFLVVKNVFPARVVDQYVKWIDVQGDANSLRHIWFPFLHILVDFEFFATVNGAVPPGEISCVKARAWLATTIFEKLLLIVDTQKEQKIKVDAVSGPNYLGKDGTDEPSDNNSENVSGVEQLWQQLLSPDLSACETETVLANKASVADSTSDLVQNAADGNGTHKSLPRNWSKHYADLLFQLLQQASCIDCLVSNSDDGEESPSNDHDRRAPGTTDSCFVTGSFLLVKAPVLKVLTSVFFPTQHTPVLSQTISSTALRDLLDEMRSFATMARDNALSLPFSFHSQFIDLLNDLTTKVHAFERWQGAFDHPDGAHDFEEIEEGVDRVVEDISPHWLLEEKLVWLNALLRLHLRRGRLDEAVCCKIAAIECVQRAGLGNGSDSSYLGHVQQWVVHELSVARGYAKRADWIEKELSICELLLVCLKQQRRFNTYQETLRYIDTLVSRLSERQESNGTHRSNSTFSFYRVRYAGGCVPALIAKDEFIYKRSKFMSLGEFVAEMKTMLRAKYPQCERVDVVPEPKSLAGMDNNPNVIFLRVTTVEEALPEELAQLKATEPRSQNWRVAFKFAVPFTLGSSSSYGKTSEQMKRITFLSVGRKFPCRLNRQRVQRRHEDTRCPIENSMDDIQKRCELLRAEIDKEDVGKTDLKTLTLVLKGSVDTHVHGGVPEVLDSFLTADPTQLIDAQGSVMSEHDSLQKRRELANLLVEFAQLCWQCLLISREAFRRSHQPSGSQHQLHLSPAALQPEQLHHVQADEAFTFLPPQPPVFSTSEPTKPATQPLESTHSLAEVSPLQTEFERSFASLVGQLVSKLPFVSPSLSHLQQYTSRLRSNTSPASAPVAPLPTDCIT